MRYAVAENNENVYEKVLNNEIDIAQSSVSAVGIINILKTLFISQK